MGRLYQAYFADKNVGISEELNAGKQTKEVDTTSIPAAVDSKSDKIKNIIQAQSKKKSKANTASYLSSEDSANPRPNITISISLDETTLRPTKTTSSNVEDKDDDMDSDNPSKKILGMSRYAQAPIASFKKGIYRDARFGLQDNALIGSGLGQILGTGVGLYKGATYNPDIIDEQTGEKKKIGLLARAALLSGGGSLGALAGGAVGHLAGDSTRLLSRKSSIANNLGA